MKRLILSIFLITTLINNGVCLDFDNSNVHKIGAGLRLGMSTRPTLDIELDVSYHPLRYVGANASLLLITPFKSKKNTISSIPQGDDLIIYEIDNHKEAAYRMAARAGLEFTTPAVMLSKNEMGLSLRVAPGITIPFPTNKTMTINKSVPLDLENDDTHGEEFVYEKASPEEVKNSGAKFCYWYVRNELVLEFEEQWEFTVGYTFSTLDLYGGSRNIKVNDTPLVINKKSPHHSITLGLTLRF